MLRQKLQEDQLTALKSGQKVKLDTLRYLIAQIKNKEIEKKSDLDNSETLSVIKKNVKELKESLAAFQKGNRTDLANETKSQLDIVVAYLPQELSDGDLKKEVEAIIQTNKEIAEANPKRLIGVSVAALKDKAEPSQIIKTLQEIQSQT